MIPDLSLSKLRRAYAFGELTPVDVLEGILERAEQFRDRNIWIQAPDPELLNDHLQRLQDSDPGLHPLWGVPFVVQDNIDLAGSPTSSACPDAAYKASNSASVVARLVKAGGVPIGKTNLDQFTSGLAGSNTPYGACASAFDATRIGGCGAATAVALGMGSFGLGSDADGGGRVPAAFNNIVGIKPTRGLLSTRGMLATCRSLDCMSLFALNCDDAAELLRLSEAGDENDPYSRANPFYNHHIHYGEWSDELTVGVLDERQLRFFGDRDYEAAYRKAVEQLSYAGVTPRGIDFTLFEQAGQLLDEGPWQAERYLAVRQLIDERPELLRPLSREVLARGKQATAAELFAAQHQLQELKANARQLMAGLDCLLVPTAGSLFETKAVAKAQIARDRELRYYSSFVNLLGLSALAIPAGISEAGLPFGISLVGDSFEDRKLLSIGRRLQGILGSTQGASGVACDNRTHFSRGDQSSIPVVVCGEHLEGLPLNWQLTERGAQRRESTETAPHYRMYALAGGPPFRPGLMRDQEGAAIKVEVWEVPQQNFGSFVAGIAAPLGIGKVELKDGDWLPGFICGPEGLDGATDISDFGDWRAYLKDLYGEKPQG